MIDLIKELLGKNLTVSKKNARKGQKSFGKRTLSCEPLEDRMLLTATTWNGTEVLNWGTTETSGSIANLGTATPDVMQAIGSGNFQDLYTVDFDTKEFAVYKNNNGNFATVSAVTSFSGQWGTSSYGTAVFVDADSDGIKDDILLISSTDDGSGLLKMNVFTYNNTAFTLSRSARLNMNGVFGSANTSSYFTGSISAICSDTDDDVFIQSNLFSISSNKQVNQIVKIDLADIPNNTSNSTIVYDNALLSESYASNGFGYKLQTTVTFNNSEYAVLSSNQINNLYFIATSGSSSSLITWDYKTDLAGTDIGVTATTPSWVLKTESNNLVFGVYTGNWDIYAATVEITNISTSGVSVNNNFNVTKLENATTTLTNDTAVLGKFANNSQGWGDLVLNMSKGNAFFTGKVVTGKTPGFNEGIVVTAPSWHSVYTADVIGGTTLGNYGTDGTNDIILVGASTIWIVDGAKYAADTTKADTSQWLYEIEPGKGFDPSFKSAQFLEDDNKLYFVAQVSDNKLSVYEMTESTDGKVGFNKTGTVCPSVNEGTGWNTQETVKDYVLGDFLGEASVAVLSTGGVSVYALKSSFRCDGESKPNAYYASTSYNYVLSIGAWENYTGEKDAIVVARGSAASNGNASLDVFSYSGTTITTPTELTTEKTSVAVKTGNVSSSDKVYFDTGVVNGSNALVYLFASNGGSYNEVGYLNSDSTTKLSFTGISLTNNVYTGLYFNYLDADQYSDLATTYIQASGTNSGTYVQSWLGAGTNAFTDQQAYQYNKSTASYTKTAICFGSADMFNKDRSVDLLIAETDKVLYYQNANPASGSCGNITVLCQFESQATTEIYETADSTDVSWIDEWTKFYLEVWVDSTAASIGSYSLALQYKPDYFIYTSVDYANAFEGHTLTPVNDTENGILTISVDGATTSNYGNSDGKVLLARVHFKPKGKVGVPLDENGNFQAVSNGFGIVMDQSNLDGLRLAATNSEYIEADTCYNTSSFDLYPVITDLNDDGNVNVLDYNKLVMYFNKTLEKIYSYTTPAAPSVRLSDINGDFSINIKDYNKLVNIFNRTYAQISDSIVATCYYESIGFDPVERANKNFVLASEAVVSPVTAPELSEDLFDDGTENEVAASAALAVVASAPVAEAPAVTSFFAFEEQTEKKTLWGFVTDDSQTAEEEDETIQAMLTRTYERRSF